MSKIYICQNSAGTLEVLNRFEVDDAIKHTEESDDEMPFTVLGSFTIPIIGYPYLFKISLNGKISYETIVAEDDLKAIDKIKSLKRYKDKEIDFKIKDLTLLINAYYK